MPNELTLYSVGMQFLNHQPFVPSSDDFECVAAIANSARKVLSLRPQIPRSPSGNAPSLIITTTGQSVEVIRDILSTKVKKGDAASKFQQGLKLIQQQDGYFHNVEGSVLSKLLNDQDLAAPLALRAREHTAQTNALAIRAASELAAVVRLPPRTRHCREDVIRFADCFRGSSARRKHKLLKAYEALIQHLRRCVPDPLYDVIRSTDEGLRVVSDLPLEWLPAQHGLPLLFERECARIPATPGNLLFLQLMPRPPLAVPVAAFRDVIVLRSFSPDDKLAPILEESAAIYLEGATNVNLRFIDCRNASDLYDALNSFEGAIAIFDGHGKVTNGQTALCVGDDLVTGNQLARSAKVPPIVILLACDTHAMDVGSATVANGLIAAGVRTVVASMLPLDGLGAAIVAGRLVKAASELLPLLLRWQRGIVRWSTLLARVLRGQVLHDCVLPFARESKEAEQYAKHLGACIAELSTGRPDWFSRCLGHISSLVGKKLKRFSDLLELTGSFPDAMLYLQLGDPSSILIIDEKIANK